MKNITGQVRVRHYRNGVLLHEGQYKNGTTLIGRFAMVVGLFSGGTLYNSAYWYMGLMSPSTVVDDDKNIGIAVEPVFKEFSLNSGNTGITEFNFNTPGLSRPQWVPQFFPGTNQTSFTSQNDVVFNIVNGGQVDGLFIIGDTGGVVGDYMSAAYIGSPNGVLWATAPFTVLQSGELINGTIEVKSGDTLSVNYETRFADVTNIGLPSGSGGTIYQDGQTSGVSEYQ